MSAAEVFPLVKTGGLADVRRRAAAGAGSRRAPTCGCCCRACRRSSTRVLHQKTVLRDRPAVRRRARHACGSASMPGSHVPAYVIDAPYLYRRDGSPYQDERRRRVARQPAALRAARLGRRAPGRRRARPGLDARRACTRTTGTPRWPAPTCAAHPADARGDGLHGAQPRLPGPVPARPTSALLGLPSRFMALDRARVPRPAVVHEGRAEVRRPHHHRQPDLRARDRDARIRLSASTA